LEVENNSQPQKKAYVLAILQLAKCVVLVDDEIEQRATFLEQSGFKAFDALHLASAEAAHVDFFCSCDDRLLKKARQQQDLSVKVLSPLELANEVPS
jgi:predicted nucleic acid-binding protein